MANSQVLYSFDLNQYDLILIVQYVKKSQVTLPLLASQPDAIESHAVEF